MLRKYPLTTLFILATICVDVALVASSSRQDLLNSDSGWPFYLWNFLIPSQISVLALWSVFGKTHRLTKAATVTLAGGVITLVHWLLFEERLFNEATVFNLFQIIVVVIGALGFRLCGVGQSDSETDSGFQFSLVEMFGWSMIVALWAFAFRSALANFPVDGYTVIWMVAATVAPLLIAPVLFGRLSTTARLVGLISAYLSAFMIYRLVEQQLPGEQIVLWAFGMAVTQITYISAWWAVTRMDEAMQERQAVSDASREKLKVFEPTRQDNQL
jgi:hypothetical protein